MLSRNPIISYNYKTNITVYLQLTNVNCDFNKNIVKLMVERNIWR